MEATTAVAAPVPAPAITCDCPVHKPGQETRVGALVGAGGGLLLGLAGAALPLSASWDGSSRLNGVILGASLAGILGAIAGLTLGIRGLALRTPVIGALFLGLLLTVVGSAIGTLQADWQVGCCLAILGLVVGSAAGGVVGWARRERPVLPTAQA